MSALTLGTAWRDITPTAPLELAGFAARRGSWHSVDEPLAVQAFAFGSTECSTPTAILVCADLLWWGQRSIARVRRAVAEHLGSDGAQVVLHASHTHAAPAVAAEFSPRLGQVDPAYLEQLEARTVAACLAAAAKPQPVTLALGQNRCGIGVSRTGGAGRGPIRPDPRRPVDDRVRTVLAYDASGAVAAVLVHYACHPVHEAGHRVSADFPATMRRAVQQGLGTDAPVGFLQGCAGDINPADLGGGGPVAGQRSGRLLGAAALRAIASGRPAPATEPTLVRATADLPLDPDLAAHPPADPVWVELAQARRDGRCIRPELKLSSVDLGPVRLLGINAEVTGEVGRALQDATGDWTLPLTCTDGMIGYLVGPRDLGRGGYEAEESWAYLFRDGPCSPEASARLVQLTTQLIRTAEEADHAG